MRQNSVTWLRSREFRPDGEGELERRRQHLNGLFGLGRVPNWPLHLTQLLPQVFPGGGGKPFFSKRVNDHKVNRIRSFSRNLILNLGLFAAGVWLARNLSDIDLMAPQPGV